MEKDYLAVFENWTPSILSHCRGYMRCLQNERIVHDLENLSHKVADDKDLQDKFDKAHDGKKPSYFPMIRAEIKDIGKLNPRMQDLKKEYASLDFIIYTAEN